MIDAANDEHAESGPWVQVSRLGNPLFNEVIVPMGKKDGWNASAARRRLGVRRRTSSSRSWRSCSRCSTRACSPTSPALNGGPGRPGGDPAHRSPGGIIPGIPELHRHHAGGHAAAQRGHPAGRRDRTARHPRRRPGRLPERPARRRRRRHDRAAGDRRAPRIRL